MDDSPSSPPEVTIEPADNGYVVRHYQRGTGKDSSGRTIRRVASTTDEALTHARAALGGAGKARSDKKKPLRNGQIGLGAGSGDGDSSPSAQPVRTMSRGSARRRRPRVGGRR